MAGPGSGFPTQRLPRRGYFPQPGVVAQATTPGRDPHQDLYPVRIAFHTRSDTSGSILVRTHGERNHFQGAGPVGARVPRVAAEAATRG